MPMVSSGRRLERKVQEGDSCICRRGSGLSDLYLRRKGPFKIHQLLKSPAHASHNRGSTLPQIMNYVRPL
ncbi:hypothetical protein INR49_015498 [Caranx melampygus]|nr:hypothetical protein INR49_015498 [Caranx melampygus]